MANEDDIWNFLWSIIWKLLELITRNQMCCSMDCTGVLDENENYTINGLNEREKGEIPFQLEKIYY